jgi:hypothetical protein
VGINRKVRNNLPNGRIAMAVGQKSASFVNCRILVLQDGKFIDLSERLKHVPEIFFFKVARDLKELN